MTAQLPPVRAWEDVAQLRHCAKFRQLLQELEGGSGRAVAALLRRAARLQPGDIAAEICVDVCWEKLHTGSWSQVLVMWRDAYTAASLLSTYGAVGAAAPHLNADTTQQADGVIAIREAASSEARVHATIPDAFEPAAAYAGPQADSTTAGNALVDSATAAHAAAAPSPAATVDALRQLDMAALLGGPLFRPLLDACITSLQSSVSASVAAASGAECDASGDGSKQSSKRCHLGNAANDAESGQQPVHQSGSALPSGDSAAASQVPVPLPPGAMQSHVVEKRPLPSLESFFEEFMCAPGGGRPVIITGAIEHWPARQRWPDMAYLRSAAGARTVPVEVGQHYLAAEWGQRLMTLSDFIDQHILSGGAPDAGQQRGYLAQHELFEQIPALRADIVEPEYCSLGSGAGPRINAWFGPPATVTPLHTDPYHNLLTQVVGRKHVRLYPPSATPGLYPFQSGFTTNCSQVDVDAPDAEQFPQFAHLEHWDCTLEPGDMLFVPQKWWHFVKALSISFSVSFWWQ